MDESKAGGGETQPAVTEQAVSGWTVEQLLTTADRYEAIIAETPPSERDGVSDVQAALEIIEAEIGTRHARGEAI